jgi:hypothetical protein
MLRAGKCTSSTRALFTLIEVRDLRILPMDALPFGEGTKFEPVGRRGSCQ